jgi:hypothetical protein
MAEYKIGYPGIEGIGVANDDTLPMWLEIGWFVIEDEPEEVIPKYVAKIVKGKETLVLEETPLPDKKESDQDITETKEF